MNNNNKTLIISYLFQAYAYYMLEIDLTTENKEKIAKHIDIELRELFPEELGTSDYKFTSKELDKCLKSERELYNIHTDKQDHLLHYYTINIGDITYFLSKILNKGTNDNIQHLIKFSKQTKLDDYRPFLYLMIDCDYDQNDMIVLTKWIQKQLSSLELCYKTNDSNYAKRYVEYTFDMGELKYFLPDNYLMLNSYKLGEHDNRKYLFHLKLISKCL
jgi:hypothetical protein